VSAVFAAAVFEAAVTPAVGQVQTFKPVTDDRLRCPNPNDWLMLSRVLRAGRGKDRLPQVPLYLGLKSSSSAVKRTRIGLRGL
jgi:hypothetical protein